MVFETDIAKYSVCRQVAGKLVRQDFATFAAAAGCADALDGEVRMINVEFSNVEGTSSISGMLYMYSRNNSRRVGSKHLVAAATKRKGL